MILITKLQVDTVNNCLVISASDDNTTGYQFTKMYIDSTSTFNCKNEPSSSATQITFKDSSSLAYPVNTPLTNYKVEFNDIICSEHPENDVLFVWIYCNEASEVYDGFLSIIDTYYYFTDGSKYYKTYGIEDVYSVTEVTKSDYEYAGSTRYAYPKIESYGDKDFVFIKYKSDEDAAYTYYKVDKSSLESGASEISESEYVVNSLHENPQPSFGVTLSVKNFYELLLNHIDITAQDSCNCNPDCSDVNFMLGWQGFNLAKTLQDYNQMIYYWNILHKFGSSSSSSGCGCNK